MNKIIPIISIIVAIISISTLKIRSNVKKMSYEMLDFSLNIKNFLDVVSVLASGVDATLIIAIQNLSNTAYTVKEMFIEIYTTDGDLIAKPSGRTDNINIVANGKTPVNIEYHITLRGLYKMLKIALEKDDLKTILQSYLDTGTLGTDVKVKGFVKAGILSININDTYTV